MDNEEEEEADNEEILRFTCSSFLENIVAPHPSLSSVSGSNFLCRFRLDFMATQPFQK